MWKIKKLGLLLCCLLFLSLPAAGFCTDTTTAQEPQTVSVPLTQWNSLNSQINQQWTIIAQQEEISAQLRSKLNLLSQNSTEQVQTLTTLDNQLTACKSQLVTVQTQLTTAQSSLTNSMQVLNNQKQTLQQNEILLNQLTAEIKQMEHHASVLQRQRDMWAVVAIGLTGYIVHEKI
ncbi:hypothetical protein [Megasphaera sueciensis]|uniref:hypothetical protein n=1 Tax=Megasphaera sueciensis TaxID=349094 RepID=UPI003D04927A